MKVLYLECAMGAAGDMLSAALLDLMDNRDKYIKKLNSLNIPGVFFEYEESLRCGIRGIHMTLKVKGKEENDEIYSGENLHHHHHHGRNLGDIEKIIDGIDVSQKIKNDIKNIYRIIAEAECEVHGVPVGEIHFHEVGAMDAVADITAVCLLLNELSPDKIVCSPVNTGSGTVKCAHGILPVPAPATALILRNIPIYGGNIKSELCTPTGAALLKYFVTEFNELPAMKIKKIGYGFGTKEFDTANCLRALLGEAAEGAKECIAELSCNVDDMTAEEISYACRRLYSGGALEVYTTAVYMKKSRQGTKISVLCHENEADNIAELLFKHTTTIGVRKCHFDRYVMDRKSVKIKTSSGEISKKISSGYGAVKEKMEYDEIAAVADENNISFREAQKLLEKHEL